MKVFKSKPLIGLDDLSDNKFTLQKLAQKEVGSITGKINGRKNADSGHMKAIQKIGASIGGKKSGLSKSKEYLKEIGKIASKSNAEKHGVRIYATNLGG